MFGIVVKLIVADLPVLAKDTLQVAIGKEYIAYSFAATDHRLLSPVKTYRRNTEFNARLAIAFLG
jgi:hypothetical protein